MENNATRFLVVANDDKPPEGYFLSTLSQAQAKENIKRVTQAYNSSTASIEKEKVRLKNGLLEHKENKELFMKCSYKEKLKYKLVSDSKSGKEVPKEDCPVALVYAVENDDVELVEEVVNCAGSEILGTRFEFVHLGTILHECTNWSSVKTLEKLLKENPHEHFDLFSVDVDGETALHNVPNEWSKPKSYDDCKKVASLLLDAAGVNANRLLGVKSGYGEMTALCKALMFNESPDVCAALLDAAASTYKEKGQDQTPQKSDTAASPSKENGQDQTPQKSDTDESHWLTAKAYGREIADVYKKDGNEDDDDDGAFCTALHLAIWKGYGDIVTKILEHPGAQNINFTSLMDGNDNTPLHVAARVGDSKICAMLLKTGTSEPDKAARSGAVQSLNKRGETPLHIASAQGNAAVCMMLLECGAPLLESDVNGRYALTNAFYEGHLEVVIMLLEFCVYSSKSKGRGKSKAASKFDINERLEFGLTLLHVAAAIPSLDHVEMLVEAGADIDCTCNDHTTPLHLAVGRKGARISKKNLAADYKESSASAVEESSDHGSRLKESSEITKEANNLWKLEEKSRETTEVIFTDSTVKESSEATKEANNPRIKDEENITSAVIKESSSEITKETATNEESSAPRVEETSEIKEAANNPRIEEESTDEQVKEVCDVVSRFLEEGARVDLQDSAGETPLHYAAQHHYDVLSTLLSKAVNPQNFKNSKEQTVANNRDEWICMCNFAGQTALHLLATRVDDPSIGRSVDLLLRKTSSPNDLLRIRDMEKMTALDLAAQNAKYKVTLIDSMLNANGIDKITTGFLLWSLREHGEDGEASDAIEHCPTYDVNMSQTSALLQDAVKEGDVDLARELVNSGADVTTLDHDEQTWLAEHLCKAASDQPTLEDTLGRTRLVEAVATLLLNPYTETPVTIGIFGSWGSGKSSFMLQVEEAILSMSVKEIFRKTRCSPSLDKGSSLTKFSKGGSYLRSMVLHALKQCKTKANKSKQNAQTDNDIIYEMLQVELQTQNCQLFRILALINRSKLFSGVRNYLYSMVLHALAQRYKTRAKKPKVDAYKKAQIEDDIILKFPKELQTKYRQLFRSLALTDRSKLVQSSLQAQYKRTAPHDVGSIVYTPAVLTLHYNAWRYDNKIEATAGLVIEISKQLESFMTPPQWLRMCWKYSWKSHPREILHYFIFPILLSVFVVCVILSLWKFVSIPTRYKALSLPVGIVSVMLPIIKACLGAIQPVTWKMLELTKSFNHQSMLGYQHQVIDDINFLKDQLCEDAHFGWALLSFLCKLFISNRYFMEGTWIWRQHPFLSNFRIVVFIDDLDRCDEKIILELLRAINLILGSCGINVVIGVDKEMLQLAITREFLRDSSDNIFDFWVNNKASSHKTKTQVLENVDEKATLEPKDSKSVEQGKKNANVDKHSFMCEFADKYLQKIIHLPIQMPEPSKKHLEKFLEGQVGRRSARPKKKQEDESKLKNQEDKQAKSKHKCESIEIAIVEGNIKDEKKPTNLAWYSQRHVNVKGGEVNIKEEDLESDDGENEPIVYRLLLANYTPLEKDMLKYLSQLTTKERDLPREWKRFLNYHRLAWTIFSQDCTMKKEKFKGWQRKLIIWIFICWNWRPQMDAIFENWHEITSKKSRRQAKLQLQDLKQNDGNNMKLHDIIGTYIKSMKDNTDEKTSTNMEKQEDEAVSKAWIELENMIKDKNDIPLNFVRKFQQFRFYCVLNHLEIND